MKKLILAAILTIAISSGLSAQAKNSNGTPANNKNNPGYVDNNKNNVCDNYENNTRQYVGRGQGQGRGSGYNRGNRQDCRSALCPGGNGRRGK